MYVVSTKRDITHVIQFRSFQTEPSKYLFLYLKVGYGMAGADPGFREEGGLITIVTSVGGYGRGQPGGLGERCKLPQWGLEQSSSSFLTFALI